MRDLSCEERRVIEEKGTEAPFTGEYVDFNINGIYHCKKCNEPLYVSRDKFNSGCGWPSFDDSIDGKVQETPDSDGRRIEIVCNSCGAHLGHIFRGEHLTKKNIRHCVNSVSLKFRSSEGSLKNAYFAGGCFWGVEYYMKKIKGVLSVISGYTGGDTDDPTYEEVKRGYSGHLEVVEVTYDSSKTDYETLVKYFMEIHDPTQSGRQGPDIGDQYNSAIFYLTEEEKSVAFKIIDLLRRNNIYPETEVKKLKRFYRAEDYHQNYYNRNGSTPYCHKYTKRF